MWNNLKGKLYIMSGDIVMKSVFPDVAIVMSIAGVIYEVVRYGKTA